MTPDKDGNFKGIGVPRVPWHEEYASAKEAQEAAKEVERRERIQKDVDAYTRMKQVIARKRDEHAEGTCPFCSKPDAGTMCDDDHCREIRRTSR